jgi:hypothetical protein
METNNTKQENTMQIEIEMERDLGYKVDFIVFHDMRSAYEFWTEHEWDENEWNMFVDGKPYSFPEWVIFRFYGLVNCW